MRARIFTIFVVAMLALPLAEAGQPVGAGPRFPGQTTHPVQASVQFADEAAPSLAAKGKKRKKKAKFTTVTRTVRQPVTQSFSSTGPIKIPGAGTSGNANPYPSAINVAGFTNGIITDVNLTLHAYSHTFARDVDVLLVLAQLPGLNALVMSDSCAGRNVANFNLTLDDQAPAPLTVPCVSGTFSPTNIDDSGSDAFLAPAPPPSGNSLLGVFNNANPNGSWQLFVVDDDIDFSGQIAGGWTLQITAEADVQIQEQVKKKRKKKR
jgi:hypothetical protein